MTARHVAFLDLDGTILDSSPGIVRGLRKAFDAVGMPAPDEAVMRSWIGPPVLRTLERELGDRGGPVVEAANRAFRAYFDEIGTYQSAPFAGIPDALAALAADGTAIVVVTHKPGPLAEAALARSGLSRFVVGVHAPVSAAELVPKEDLFARAIRKARPATAIAAGDRAGDVEAAAAHGIRSIGVLWGYGTPAELTGAGAVALAPAPSDLPFLLAPGGTLG